MPGSTLVIAGEGFIVKQSKPGVEYKNQWMTDEQLIDEIASSDLVVFPYLEASQSGTIPICNSLGIPVIVTPVGGLPEQVMDGIDGLITKDITPKSLSEAITIALYKEWTTSQNRSNRNENFVRNILRIR